MSGQDALFDEREARQPFFVIPTDKWGRKGEPIDVNQCTGGMWEAVAWAYLWCKDAEKHPPCEVCHAPLHIALEKWETMPAEAIDEVCDDPAHVAGWL